VGRLASDNAARADRITCGKLCDIVDALFGD
jgi:hypothetical protein